MKRRHWVIGGAGAAAAAAGVSWQWLGQRGAGSTAATPATSGATAAGSPDTPQSWWSYELERPDGSLLTLGALRGQPLIVNFWATWCPPCVREMPMIERFYRGQKPQAGRPRWRILGLAVDKRHAVADYLKANPVSYDIAVAGFDAMQWGRDWGNDKNGLPFTVAFSADGRILQRKLGELSEGELDQWRHV
jgi:thiol-disulfide isomerase/thioredoxin